MFMSDRTPSSSFTHAPAGAKPVQTVLGRRGLPLPAALATTMSSRFGHDFSAVRVHSDGLAARSAASIGSRAFTIGNDVVFGAGEFAPESATGQGLIAHELAHVVQQRATCSRAKPASLAVSTPGDPGEREADAAARSVTGGDRAPRLRAVGSGIQRSCGTVALGAPAPDCTESHAGVVGWQLKFKVNCDELLPGEEAVVKKPKAGSDLKIHGFASLDGPPLYNMDLSCHRANRVAELARTMRPDCRVAGVFKHGASPQAGPGVVPDANPSSFWRSAFIEEIRPSPETPQPATSCGPDATDWLIKQTITAKKNAKVLAIRNKLDAAALLAPTITTSATMNASEILEGAVVEKVADQRQKAGNPAPTAEANQQLGELSAVFGVAELTVAKTAVLGLNARALATLTLLRDASLLWKGLVGTRMPFDFKNDPSTMGNPRSAHCPDGDCANSITVCPGSSGSNCFGKDFPGNVVYAHVGAFAGFSENALQLGSQWAQLQSTKTWDPPEDTEMIHFAFNLPTPLDRVGFCSALQGAKGGFKTQPCGDCGEQAAASLIDP